MAYSAVHVSNNILKRAFDSEVSVSPMKLQKILFFVASEYAKRTGRQLLSESFEAWAYGPVVRSVYDEFRSFGGSAIRAYGKDARGKAYMADEDADPDLDLVLSAVWDATRDRTAVHLSRITHRPDSAWSTAETNSERISHDAMVADISYRDVLGLADS